VHEFRLGLTFNENHLSTLETTKQFVHKIMLPYLHIQITQLRLQENQKIVWLFDCWPNIFVIFIPPKFDQHPLVS